MLLPLIFGSKKELRFVTPQLRCSWNITKFPYLLSLRRLVQSASCPRFFGSGVFFYCALAVLFSLKGNVIQRFLHGGFNGFLKDTAVKAAVMRLAGNHKIVAVRIVASLRVNQTDY